MSDLERLLPGRFGADKTHLRSFAASFWRANFCHPFSIAAEKVLSLGPARCLVSFQKDEEAAKAFAGPLTGCRLHKLYRNMIGA